MYAHLVGALNVLINIRRTRFHKFHTNWNRNTFKLTYAADSTYFPHI